MRVSIRPDEQPLAQFAALPFRFRPELEILVISSRETQRWVIPKGWPIKGLAPFETAMREAFEEAGVSGRIDHRPLGRFHYVKRLRGGASVSCSVKVFPMLVERQAKSWPEKHERILRWLPVTDAMACVEEAELKKLLAQFADMAAHNPPALVGRAIAQAVVDAPSAA